MLFIINHFIFADPFLLFIWILVFIFSNVLIGINPYSLKLHIIRLLSCIIILYLIYKNSNNVIGSISLLTPFCQEKINYVHEFEVKSLYFYESKKSFLFLETLTKDLTSLLDNLNEKDSYWTTFCFYPGIYAYNNEEAIQLWISEPIIINRDSNPLLFSKFLMNKLNLMIDLYYLDDTIINSSESIIVLKYLKIELK